MDEIMKNYLIILTFLTHFFSSFAIAQTNKEDCPPLFTRSLIKYPITKISRIEVLDSNTYLTYPKFTIDDDSINKLVNYPEVAKRVAIKGDVVIQISIDSIGMIRDAKLIKAIGAGCDEAILDFLLNTKPKFKPATNVSGEVHSEILVWFSVSFYDVIDKPDLILDEIIFEDPYWDGNKKLTLNKSGNVKYLERIYGTSDLKSPIQKIGKLKTNIYNRLSDFIISQCFLEYDDHYYKILSDHTFLETITVKTDSITKRVTSANQGDPVGLWAIIYILRHIEDQVQWEEAKE